MLTATGIGSGLDIEGLVSQLVAAERNPVENRLVRNEAVLTAELSAFGSFKGAIASFQNSQSALNDLSTYGQRNAVSTDDSVVTAVAGTNATAASYDLSVSQLAKPHSLASGSFSSLTDVVGTGTLTIRFGTTDYIPPNPGPESYNGFQVNPDRSAATLNIDSSNNTLEGVKNAINEANIGVTASIVNDGSGYRLLMNSDRTGEENSIEIRVSDTGDGNNLDAAGLSALAFNSDSNNLIQTASAQNASFTINGLAISSAENSIKGVIDDVDIELKSISGSGPTSIAITQDKAGVKDAVSDFITGYNDFINTANNLMAYDAQTGTAGALQGDYSARSVVGQLRGVLSSQVEGFAGPFSTLSEIGISTQSDGTLQLDSAKLDKALGDNFSDVVGIFAAIGFPSDTQIDYQGATEETAVGSFGINISQLATKGQLAGGVAAFPLVIDANNDNFSLQVDGISSGSISITNGSYADGNSLAAELQSRINGDASLAAEDRKVLVTFNTDHFEITSDRYGAGSRVAITSVDPNSTSDLGFAIASGIDGLDVAGTIDGVAAIGSGQILTGAVGSNADGLQLRINGGALGARGSVDFSRGVSYQIDKMIGDFLEADGLLDARTDGIQARIDDIGDQREALDKRIEALEARFRARFNALDGLLAQLQSTSSFLSQQLASLPKAGSLLNRN